jgi:hypothetical protein
MISGIQTLLDLILMHLVNHHNLFGPGSCSNDYLYRSFWSHGKNLENSLLVYFIKVLNRSEFYHRDNLNTRTYLAIFLIATSIAIGTTTSIATPALADKSSGDNGLDKADVNIHDNTGFGSQPDIRHHEGTCQGGHEVHITDGCDNALITDPGNSDGHHK